MIALAVLVGAVAGFVLAWVINPLLRPFSPSPPPDHTPLIIDAISRGMANAAEAVGKAVQTAQYAPPEPTPQTRRVPTLDADLIDGIIDASDPTDIGWLHPDRPDVVFEAPPGGWPGDG